MARVEPGKRRSLRQQSLFGDTVALQVVGGICQQGQILAATLGEGMLETTFGCGIDDALPVTFVAGWAPILFCICRPCDTLGSSVGQRRGQRWHRGRFWRRGLMGTGHRGLRLEPWLGALVIIAYQDLARGQPHRQPLPGSELDGGVPGPDR